MHTLQIAMIIFFENTITLMQTNKKLLKIVLVLYFFASAIKKKAPTIYLSKLNIKDQICVFISQVIWKNRNQKHVITVGSFVFVGNGAYSVSHPSNSPHYDLVIKNVQKNHSGVYECQVSTREVMSIDIQLNVIGRSFKREK